MESGAQTIRFPSATGSLLFLLIVGWCQADVENFHRTVNKNYMWIAAVASGVGALVVMAVILIISTIFIRRYEKKRLQEILSMAPIIIRATSPEDEGPGDSMGYGHQGPSSPVEADARSPGHVYYNRAMDIDETPEVNSPTLLLPGAGPGKSPVVPRRSAEVSVC